MPGAYRNNELIAGAGGTAATGRGTLADIRWRPVRNTTDETIPPFAVMAFYASRRADGSVYRPYEDGEQSNLSSQEVRDGQVIWLVKKPGEQDEALQQPALLIFNSALEIAPGQYGLGTQDWPAPALMGDGDGSDYYSESSSTSDEAGEGYVFGQCGPKADSWGLHGTGAAFRILSPDETEQLPGRKILRWFAPNIPRREIYIADYGSRIFTIDSGETQEITLPDYNMIQRVSPSRGEDVDQRHHLLSSGDRDIIFNRPAKVVIEFHLNIQVNSSTQSNPLSAPNDYPIQITPTFQNQDDDNVFAITDGAVGLHPLKFHARKVVSHTPSYAQTGWVMPAGDQSRNVFGYYEAEKEDTLKFKIKAGAGHSNIAGTINAMVKISEI